MANHNLFLLPGDGIGPEVIGEVRRVVAWFEDSGVASFNIEEGLVGGSAYDVHGEAISDADMDKALAADAVLFGAVGGPKWDDPQATVRPEQGLLQLRQALGAFANLRPVHAIPALMAASPLKEERLEGVDFLVVRELTGGIYFGDKSEGTDQASDLCTYSAEEVSRIVRLAGNLARGRRNRLTLVDKANVLATSRLWRAVTQKVISEEYPDLDFDILLVDAAAMSLITEPARFDVIVTENMFGDILTDEAATLAGSIGILPSASLSDRGPGLFEPIHGSAPDLAGTGRANPFGTLLSTAMMLELGLGLADEGQLLRDGVAHCIEEGRTTGDLGGSLGTDEATQAVLDHMEQRAAA